MSKFFETKKSGSAKTRPLLKTGIIASVMIAITAAAGFGGYKLMQGSDRSETRTTARPYNNGVINELYTPPARSINNFSSFGEQRTSTKVDSGAKKSSSKHVAKHSNSKKKSAKHVAKHSKKKHGKHMAKHSKKKHGKHLAKHSKKKHVKQAKHSKKKKNARYVSAQK